MSSALQVGYATLAELQVQSHEWWREVLAVVCFDGAVVRPLVDGIPTPAITTAVLGDDERHAEIWRLRGPMRSGQHGRVHYRCSERLLFASLSLAERGFVNAARQCAHSLQAVTEAAYVELFSALEALGFPHALRIWNFLPQIHGGDDGLKRYWQFNVGRRDVFVRTGRSIAGDVPAASVLGTGAETVSIYCIAGVQPPISVENPRQCSPWEYPAQYGPQPPTFARACIDSQQTLFISGTASIVGHHSEHAGDVGAQTRETLSNIRSLIGAANERVGSARYAPEHLRYKVYVRHPEDQPTIERELHRQVGEQTLAMFLRADICRPELLVEIEAVGA